MHFGTLFTPRNIKLFPNAGLEAAMRSFLGRCMQALFGSFPAVIHERSPEAVSSRMIPFHRTLNPDFRPETD